jgi:hypothetical protein
MAKRLKELLSAKNMFTWLPRKAVNKYYLKG